MVMTNCLFCKIISGNSPADILYRDEEIIIFKDIKPASTFHYLSVPIKHIENVNSLNGSQHSQLCKKSKFVFVDANGILCFSK